MRVKFHLSDPAFVCHEVLFIVNISDTKNSNFSDCTSFLCIIKISNSFNFFAFMSIQF